LLSLFLNILEAESADAGPKGERCARAAEIYEARRKRSR
jgi:hypothetical protein